MKFTSSLLKGRLVLRYKRFLADIELENGEHITAHCANPGSMAGLKAPGCPVWVAKTDNPKRKLKYDWHIIEEPEHGVLVGIHTNWPNKLVAEALKADHIPELAGYDAIRPEVKYGKNSRIDFLLEREGHPPCYVEVKSITFSRIQGLAEFPDSPTARGTKHLGELQAMAEQGARAVMLYVIQREDCQRFTIAKDIDPAYEKARIEAQKSGLESLAYACKITPQEIYITTPVRIV
ncbi:MAG: DNA/RNA nuclease SfsA [Robiginitomaculum sp.]|nr:MAG: DNA/RNA nuclease SfsA [Robiginitomaculum sp.]